ncbi:hypothetical protein HDU76_010021 [Blyttiomyces sp. JEL0837]|nr:hypothetical protein HDU76_010021 [Blyttiomyces sp. JEL0837]
MPGCQHRVPTSSVTLVQMVAIWGFAALVVWFTIMGFFLYSSTKHKGNTNLEKLISVWQHRLEFCCFGRNSHLTDSKDVLRDIAKELADYFHDVDWAPSDVAVGLILLKREQKRITEIRQARRLILEQPRGFSIPTVESSDTLVELAAASREAARAKRNRAMRTLAAPGAVRAVNTTTITTVTVLDPVQTRALLPAGGAEGGHMEMVALSSGIVDSALGPVPLSLQVIGRLGSVDEDARTRGNTDQPPEQEPIEIRRTQTPDLLEDIPEDRSADFKTTLAKGITVTITDAERKTKAQAAVASADEIVVDTTIMSPPSPSPLVMTPTITTNPGLAPKTNRQSLLESPVLDDGKSDISGVSGVSTHNSRHSTAPLTPPSVAIPLPTPTLSSPLMAFTRNTTRKLLDRKASNTNEMLSTTSARDLGAGGSSSPSTPQSKRFKPWWFRKKRKIGHHRAHRKNPVEKGTVTREEIDDILHFARYAEVIYEPEELIAMHIESERLFRHSPDNALFKSPYLIVHDPDADSLVIAIRGTFSAADVLVDLKFDLAELQLPDLKAKYPGVEHWAHSGFLRSAENIVKEIRELNILDPLLKDENSEFYDCGLVVTGHSLGAGVAALVACMLREDYPSACCYAFEPPGCTVSSEAAEYLESFCTSVVMGDDIVPRMNRNTMEMLKLDVARLINACDHPKWQIFGSVMGARLCFRSSRLGAGKEKTERPGLLHRRTPSGHLSPEDLALIRRRTQSLKQGWVDDEDHHLPTTPMYVPGKILYIEKLRRPPLRLDQAIGGAIGGAIDKAKETTKVVGEKILGGAEGIKDKILDGAEGIKDKILDGAEGIREKLKDGAEGFKDILKDGAEGIREVFSREKIRGEDGYTSASGDEGLSPRRRAGSMGDILGPVDRSLARSRSMSDFAGGAFPEGGVVPLKDHDGTDRPAKRRTRKRTKKSARKNSTSVRQSLDDLEANKSEGEDLSDYAGTPRGRSFGRRSSGSKSGGGVLSESESEPELFSPTSAVSSRRGKSVERKKRTSVAFDDFALVSIIVNPRLDAPNEGEEQEKSKGDAGAGVTALSISTPDLRRSHDSNLRKAMSMDVVGSKSPKSPKFRPNPILVGGSHGSGHSQSGKHVDIQEPSPTSPGPDELVLSKPQYPPSYAIKKAAADKEHAGPRRPGKYHYIPRWGRKEEFQEVTVSRSMVIDHFPFEIMRELQAAPPGSILGMKRRSWNELCKA